MTSHAIILIGIGLLCVASSLPQNRRQWFYPIFDTDLLGECVHIDHPCNEAFNRTYSESYAKFPNTRGTTLQASMDEFNDFFAPLYAKPSGCYLALWSLLCFHYFPQCHPSLPLKYIVTPCRETCERARRECEDFILMRNLSWPEHMDCVKFNSSYDDHLCINSTADAALVDKMLITGITTTQPPSTASTSATSTEPTSITTQQSTTPTPTTDPPPEPPSVMQRGFFSALVQCHPRCNHRTKATGGTFKNNDYTFAANVTILDSRGSAADSHHTFLAKITRLWILDHQNCSRYENHTLVLIRTSLSQCPVCPNFNTTAGGNVYLVSGYCNLRGLYLPPNDSLVSLWHLYPKYETKLEMWIRNGIAARAQN